MLYRRYGLWRWLKPRGTSPGSSGSKRKRYRCSEIADYLAAKVRDTQYRAADTTRSARRVDGCTMNGVIAQGAFGNSLAPAATEEAAAPCMDLVSK